MLHHIFLEIISPVSDRLERQKIWFSFKPFKSEFLVRRLEIGKWFPTLYFKVGMPLQMIILITD